MRRSRNLEYCKVHGLPLAGRPCSACQHDDHLSHLALLERIEKSKKQAVRSRTASPEMESWEPIICSLVWYPGITLQSMIDRLESSVLDELIKRNGGNRSAAARLLGMSGRTVRSIFAAREGRIKFRRKRHQDRAN